MPEDQFDYAKLPDGSYAKFAKGTSPEKMRSTLESKGLLKGKQGGAGGSWEPDKTIAGPRGVPIKTSTVEKAAATLPAVGATVGAVAGGPMGAALGGAAGEAGKQLSDTYLTKTAAPKTGISGAKDIAVQGVSQGAQEYVLGNLLPKGLSKLGQKAIPKTLEAVNRYIGIMKSDLPKWERFKLQSVHDVGKTVLEKVGLKGTLEAQKDAIEATRGVYNQATENLVKNTVGAKLTPAHAMIDSVGNNLTRDLELMGRTPEQLAAVQKNVEAVKAAYPKANATAEELLNMRREIQKDINWSTDDPTDVRQKFLQQLYFDSNEAIKNALPKAQAGKFAEFNKIQHNLIVARTAAERKLTVPAYEKGGGLATKAATVATGAGVGAGLGALAGLPYGRSKEDATIGALLGGAGGLHGGNLRPHVSAPVTDIRVNQILATVAPKMAKLAKHSATAARALEAIKAIQGTQPSQ